jgi:hypothetical protein
LAIGTDAQRYTQRAGPLNHAWLAVLIAGLLVVAAPPAAANHIAYSSGDVFAGVGNGKINHYGPTGTFLETLDTTTGPTHPPGNQTGMCFDPAGNLYATDYDAFDMAKFDKLGGLTTHPFGPAFSHQPESCVVDQAGLNVYVGTGELNNELFRLDTNGNVLDDFLLARDQGGINWIDINPSAPCQLYYTSEGTLVKRYDVCTHTQLSDFASGLPFGSAGCFGLRVRTNGQVLVACDQDIVRLNANGSVSQFYNPGNENDYFALALDPDGASFWAAGYSSGHIYKVNLANGTVGTNFVAPPATDTGLAGLAVYGDGPADPGYPHPRGASPLRAPLVPAFNKCTTGNRVHGAPLAFGSCTPPVQQSTFLTIGTPEANGQAANSVGSVQYTVIPGDSGTAANEADVRIEASVTDVRKKSDLSDYTGQLHATALIRSTDRYSSADVATQPFNDTGTGSDTPFSVTVPCVATPSTSIGSTCSISTTANATVPGSVLESNRTVWQLGQVQVYDGGASGVAGSSDAKLFMDEGVAVP